jgi:hypothetical protein
VNLVRNSTGAHLGRVPPDAILGRKERATLVVVEGVVKLVRSTSHGP